MAKKTPSKKTQSSHAGPKSPASKKSGSSSEVENVVFEGRTLNGVPFGRVKMKSFDKKSFVYGGGH